MKRRTFLSQFALILGSTFVPRTFAQTHDMSKMADVGHDMAAMSSMENTVRLGVLGKMSFTPEEKLLPEGALTKHSALPQLNLLSNQSTQSGQFTATLVAKPVEIALTSDVKTEFWAYNDQVPGPFIEVFEGDTVSITLKNELPQATTIHWHGLHVPPDQDGNPQDEVPAGSSKTYTFKIPLGTAGTYWYHPHGHLTVPEQVFRGLAGAFIVKEKTDPLAHLPRQNWLISDLKLDDKGKIAPNSLNDWMDGREGQFVLINGAYQPKITLETATRVHVWNACSGRYLNLALNDAMLYLIGTDGGLIEKPQKIDHLLLSPGERAELLIVPTNTGQATLRSLSYDRGRMGNTKPDPDRTLAIVALSKSVLPKLPEILRKRPELGPATATKQLEYTEIMKMENGSGELDFLINGKAHNMERIDLTSKLGEIEEWVIFNNSHMDHNFHLHGTQFIVQEFELAGKKYLPEVVAYKDTVNLKPMETVRIKTVQNFKGIRMYHCHILEHEDIGMMGQLEII